MNVQETPRSLTGTPEGVGAASGVGRVRPIASGLLALVGLGLSSYLTLTHYFARAVPLACSATGAIDCEKVTTSPQSVVFGIPVAVLGLAFFVPMLALCSPWAWASSRREVAVARLVLATAGMGFVLYLVSMELFVIGAICLYCTGVHLTTFLLFALVATAPLPAVTGSSGRSPGPPGVTRSRDEAKPR